MRLIDKLKRSRASKHLHRHAENYRHLTNDAVKNMEDDAARGYIEALFEGHPETIDRFKRLYNRLKNVYANDRSRQLYQRFRRKRFF